MTTPRVLSPFLKPRSCVRIVSGAPASTRRNQTKTTEFRCSLGHDADASIRSARGTRYRRLAPPTCHQDRAPSSRTIRREGSRCPPTPIYFALQRNLNRLPLETIEPPPFRPHESACSRNRLFETVVHLARLLRKAICHEPVADRGRSLEGPRAGCRKRCRLLRLSGTPARRCRRGGRRRRRCTRTSSPAATSARDPQDSSEREGSRTGWPCFRARAAL